MFDEYSMIAPMQLARYTGFTDDEVRNLCDRYEMDYKEVGGAPLLGINGCVIKAHGSSDAKAFASAIRQAELFVKGNVNPKIAEAIASLPDEE